MKQCAADKTVFWSIRHAPHLWPVPKRFASLPLSRIEAMQGTSPHLAGRPPTMRSEMERAAEIKQTVNIRG